MKEDLVIEKKYLSQWHTRGSKIYVVTECHTNCPYLGRMSDDGAAAAFTPTAPLPFSCPPLPSRSKPSSSSSSSTSFSTFPLSLPPLPYPLSWDRLTFNAKKKKKKSRVEKWNGEELIESEKHGKMEIK